MLRMKISAIVHTSSARCYMTERLSERKNNEMASYGNELNQPQNLALC
jgi:hypothetical protein